MSRSNRLLLLALAGSTLLAPASASAVVGGSPAPPGRWPFMVAIVGTYTTDAFRGETCGGTVIAPRRVLTAAHCVAGSAPAELKVIAGRTRLSQPGGHEVAVTGVAAFPGYVSGTQFLDAAVLTLAEDAGVPPVRLATAADAATWAPGAPAWTAGWGRLNAAPTANQGSYYADRLRELQQPLVSDDACESIYGGGTGQVPYRPQWNLCAGTLAGGSGTCYGDSGGPLASLTPAGWVQIGIVLGGDGCAEAGYYDIYTRADRVDAFAHRAKLTFQPFPVSPPRIRGKLKEGARVKCVNGAWANRPTGFTVQWHRLNAPAALPDDRTSHKVSGADAAYGLECVVTAGNAGGFYEASSAPRRP
jgi:trypsin